MTKETLEWEEQSHAWMDKFELPDDAETYRAINNLLPDGTVVVPFHTDDDPRVAVLELQNDD